MNNVSERAPNTAVERIRRVVVVRAGWSRHLRHYGLALLLVAGGMLVRLALTHFVGPGLPTYITFYPAVMLAALIGGWRPGLLATLATAAVVDYGLLPPQGSLKIESMVDGVGIVFFCAMGLFMSVVAELYRRARDHSEELVGVRTAALHQANEQLQQQTEELQAQSEELTTANEELRESAQALRESEERFRAAYEQAAIGMEMLDLAGRFLRGNGWLSQMLGYREVELQRHTFAQITHPDDLQAELPLLEQLLAGKTPSYSLEKRYLHKDGHPIWVRVTSSLVRTSSPYRISIIEDITERRHSVEALRELNATLEDKVAERTAELEHRARQLQKLTLELSEAEDRERRRLAEVLHDDLQQVLAAAKFHLGLLNAQVKNDPSPQAIVGKVNQMLVDAIAKSRSLSHDLSPAVLHHDDFAETLRWLAGRMQAQHGLTVHVEAPAEINIPSDTLKSFLYKAVRELLFNVVKHARVKEAHIRVRPFGRYLGLSVCDGGRGFDPTEVRQTAGFGLLSIRERIELLGGRMMMHSTAGQGSTFFIVVPDGRSVEGRGRKTEDRRPPPSSFLRLPTSVLRHPSSGSCWRTTMRSCGRA